MTHNIQTQGYFRWLTTLMVTTLLFLAFGTRDVLAKNLELSALELSKNFNYTYRNNRVLLRRTSHGVVHVTASGYAGIGYGVGYAYTQDNRCLLAHRIAEVNGRLSEQLGADAPVRSEVHDLTYTALQSDHYYRGWFDIEKIRAGFEKGAPEVQELAKGYAAGVNRFLKRHSRAEPCAVKFNGEVTQDDVYRMWVATASIASGEVLTGLLPHAAPSSSSATVQGGTAKSKIYPAILKRRRA
ncbi:MAG: penicillin acylase family protein [Methylococcaceae bacterium]